MNLKLYDLAAADEKRRFSPYCWRAKMALRHKGLDVEEIPWRFVEKDVIAFSGQGNVPVLVDGDQTIVDSWEIARYLEVNYQDLPSLFGCTVGEAEALFIKFWSENTLHPLIFQLVIPDLYDHLDEKNQVYFRARCQRQFGMTIEEFKTPKDEVITTLKQSLAPLRATLEHQPYLGGTEPSFADYIVFGAFQWARSISPIKLLSSDDPVYAWRDRLLNAFDGYARNALGYDV